MWPRSIQGFVSLTQVERAKSVLRTHGGVPASLRAIRAYDTLIPEPFGLRKWNDQIPPVYRVTSFYNEREMLLVMAKTKAKVARVR